MNTLVAIVGRPNVGKSTLVNRFVGQRLAIVDDMPGVTRDRLYFGCEWTGHEFIVIDTGGIIFGEQEDELLESVQKQAWMAIDEAAVIIFVVDGREGLHPMDLLIANELRQKHKKVLVAVNKVEQSDNRNIETAEFYELALDNLFPISALHSIGVGDLLDEVIKRLDFPKIQEDKPEKLHIAIVGRPNVGKSSIVNALTGQDRVTVSNIPGTTRDAIDTVCKINGEEYVLIDTAGIRKKSKVRYGIERFSVVRAIKAIHRADVVVVVVDATEPVSEQDQRIAGIADELGKACVVVVNKWDLIENKDSGSMNDHADKVRKELYFVNYASILYTSALTKKRIFSLFDVAKAASDENQRRITTGLFNEVLNEIVAMIPPPSRSSKRPRIRYGTQVSVKPPTFVLFTNHPELIEQTYVRYIEKKVRENLGFHGTPLRFILRQDIKRQNRPMKPQPKPK